MLAYILYYKLIGENLMKFKVFFDKEENIYRIQANSNEDLNELLKTEAFAPAKNAIAIFKSKKQIVGRADNKMHLQCLRRMVDEKSSEFADAEICLKEIDQAITHLLAFTPEHDETIYFHFKGTIAASMITAEFNSMLDLMETALHNTAFNANGMIANDEEDAFEYVSRGKANNESRYIFDIKIDFNNPKHVGILADLLEQIASDSNEYKLDIQGRREILVDRSKENNKENFVRQLMQTDVLAWQPIFEKFLSLKGINITGITNTSFNWINGDASTYNSNMTNIVTFYDTKKGFFRQNGLFASQYSSVIEELKGSGNKSPEERKVIVANYFASVFYDTQWKKDVAADEAISASTKAILSLKL